jgi:hypothetical protein
MYFFCFENALVCAQSSAMHLLKFNWAFLQHFASMRKEKQITRCFKIKCSVTYVTKFEFLLKLKNVF